MLGYYLRLAWLSLKRTPAITLLMIGAIAVGIGATTTTLTVYHLMSSNPIAYKNDVLRAVTTTDIPAIPAAARIRSLTVTLSSAVKRSRLSTNKVAAPLPARSSSRSAAVPSNSMTARICCQPRATVRIGLRTTTRESAAACIARCLSSPDFPTPESPRISK